MIILIGKSDWLGVFMKNSYASTAPEVGFVSPPIQRPSRHLPLGGRLKRVFDLASSGFALLLLAPLMLGVALAVRATSKGPALYGHTRIGHGGRRFKCWKFRSMVVDGDAVLARYLRDNPSAQAEWDETQKLQNDPRVTPIGRVLRKLSVDELPQLLNIFFGEMSVVGPRPVTENELYRYKASAAHYLSTRPGLTGLWQVSGRSDVSYHRRVLLDRYYVAKWSFLVDVSIILRTLPAVIFARGSC